MLNVLNNWAKVAIEFAGNFLPGYLICLLMISQSPGINAQSFALFVIARGAMSCYGLYKALSATQKKPTVDLGTLLMLTFAVNVLLGFFESRLGIF